MNRRAKNDRLIITDHLMGLSQMSLEDESYEGGDASNKDEEEKQDNVQA